ncbi:MAG TPA: efflux transporter outer membrane subunit [Bryobacteraceae bacterium]|nr:efflux transporter outer membrane subunit [Bryobacteraceae bacterium]
MSRRWPVLMAALCCGCMVGPNYRRPAISIPDAYRSPAGQSAGAPGTSSFGELAWWQVFQDAELQKLLTIALDRNYDIRIAAARIEQAAANVGIVRADQFPAVGADATFSRTRTSATGFSRLIPGFSGFTTSTTSITPSVSWALDFWGRYRRATESARAQLLASESAQLAVRTSLVAAVASAYFRLRELDLELEITKRALATRRDSLRLTQIREQGGVASLLEVRQAESLVTTATATIPQVVQQIEQTENQISILLGGNPDTVPRGLALDQQKIPPMPPGLPSELLARRPDIRQAEQILIAANAQIGVARAAYFPNVLISASTGFQASRPGDLFSKSGWVWGLTPTLNLPIFTAGRIQSSVRFTEAQRQEAVLAYQRTIQQAFREVSDALIGFTRTTDFRIQQEMLTATYRDAARLAEVRYRGGVTTYLEVLDSERNVYSAELTLAQARLNELASLVQLYNALGGGWQQ